MFDKYANMLIQKSGVGRNKVLMGDHSVYPLPITKGENQLLRNWRRMEVEKTFWSWGNQRGGTFLRK